MHGCSAMHGSSIGLWEISRSFSSWCSEMQCMYLDDRITKMGSHFIFGNTWLKLKMDMYWSYFVENYMLNVCSSILQMMYDDT